MDSGDIATVLVALLYCITQLIITIYSARKSNAAKKQATAANLQATEAKDIVAEVNESVGPRNGSTVRDLLYEIKTFQEYQHNRNHDIMNLLVSGNAKLDFIGMRLGLEMPNREKLLPLFEQAVLNYKKATEAAGTVYKAPVIPPVDDIPTPPGVTTDITDKDDERKPGWGQGKGKGKGKDS